MTSPALEALLEPKLVGDIDGDFYVPSYQRGYRWGRDEVGRLLEDIWESRDQPYYLQPVVVKRHGDEWELVDGQQRLTTLYLIFGYMVREGLQSTGAGYRIRYETREASAAYLEDPDPARSKENIDFFHINEAYRCIAEWFDAHEHRRQHAANKFYAALFDQVRIIWYQAPKALNATELFTRLNVGRIPLTEAELVKALLLSRSRTAESGDRSREIAAQWDAVERDLRDPELWAFITASATEAPTHISLLLDTLAGRSDHDEAFHTFEALREQVTAEPQGFWNSVLDLHSLLIGWYSDRDLFHKIGYLIAQGVRFRELIARSGNKTKSAFESELDGLVAATLRLSESGLRDLQYRNKTVSGRALLLMNVETVRQRGASFERYSFFEHAKGHWSLEHIHAQNAEPLNRAEQWRSWLELHRAAFEALGAHNGEEKRELIERIDEVLGRETLREQDFRPLERLLTAIFSQGGDTAAEDIDSIANLALLAGGDNTALSNSVFAVKRSVVLELDRAGSYVPVCTRNVFLKYYSPGDEHQMQFWSRWDRQHYLEEIVAKLQPYLVPESEEAVDE
jgi:hypothetical protein